VASRTDQSPQSLVAPDESRASSVAESSITPVFVKKPVYETVWRRGRWPLWCLWIFM